MLLFRRKMILVIVVELILRDMEISSTAVGLQFYASQKKSR